MSSLTFDRGANYRLTRLGILNDPQYFGSWGGNQSEIVRMIGEVLKLRRAKLCLQFYRFALLGPHVDLFSGNPWSLNKKLRNSSVADPVDFEFPFGI